jgi:hypothetical protein
MSMTFAPLSTEPVATEAPTGRVCRWCCEGFGTVPQLLDHVVTAHLDEPADPERDLDAIRRALPTSA